MRFWLLLILEYLLAGFVFWYLIKSQNKTHKPQKPGKISHKINLKIKWFCNANGMDLVFIPFLFFVTKIFFETIPIVGTYSASSMGILAVTLGTLHCTLEKINSPTRFAWTWIAGFSYILFLLEITIRSKTGLITFPQMTVAALTISGMTTLLFLIIRSINNTYLHNANEKILDFMFLKDGEEGLIEKNRMKIQDNRRFT